MSKIKIPKRTDWQIIEENSDSVILSEKDSVVIEGNKNNNYITCVIKNKEKREIDI